MGSLSKCLKKAGLSEHENAILRGAVSDYRDDGFEAHESAVKAVLDHIEGLIGERADIAGQIEKFGGEAPANVFDMAAARAIAYGEKSEEGIAASKREPKTIEATSREHLREILEAGDKAHYDFDGTYGTTLWVENDGRTWVLKQKDDDSEATITKGPAKHGDPWSKFAVVTRGEEVGRYRFTEFKPKAQSEQAPVDHALADAVKRLTDLGVQQDQINQAVKEYKDGDKSLLEDLERINRHDEKLSLDKQNAQVGLKTKENGEINPDISKRPGAFEKGDQIRVRGEDNRVETVDSVGNDGWVYTLAGSAFPPEKLHLLYHTTGHVKQGGGFGDYGAIEGEQVALSDQNASQDLVTEVTGGIEDAKARYAVASQVGTYLLGGNSFETIVQGRAFVAGKLGLGKIDAGTQEAKYADEIIEAGIVEAARSIVNTARLGGKSPEQVYTLLTNLYERQPRLGVRTSTSMREQAYSTPAPLAYLASQLAGIDENTRVYEPTAGNGMLLIGATPKNIVANELNQDRFDSLKQIFPAASITQGDALANDVARGSVDAVIANPPFGIVKDSSGQTVIFETAVGYPSREVDHAIAFKALDAMPDDGRAVLIVGGVRAESEEERKDGYRAKSKREFYFNLYQNYNVVNHFTVNGDLYEKQGAGYPVDVIVIAGRGEAERMLPAANLPTVYNSWGELKEILNENSNVGTGRRERATSDGSTGSAGQDHGSAMDRGAGGSGTGDGERGGRSASGTTSGGTGIDGGGRGDAAGGSGAVRGANAGDAQSGLDHGNGASESRVSANSDKQRQRTGADGRSGQLDRTGVDGTAPVSNTLPDRRGQETETDRQVSYDARSKSSAVGTLVPVNMRDAVQDSLDRLEQQVGDLDEYVADRLNLDVPNLYASFSAEQVDALAMAINNAENGGGFIIGDQTGIGKGRIVAGMIKYAIQRGLTPIFVTEKPNLYADMLRDLTDIGMGDELGYGTSGLRVLMTNDIRVPYGNDGEFEMPRIKGKAGAVFNQIERDGTLPKEYKAVFTTYAQLQTVKGDVTDRMKAIRALAPNAYLILDESHNAGGTGTEERLTAKQKAAAAKNGFSGGRAGFMRLLVNNAKASFFSSATYAKRPNVMDLYSSTNMILAVDKPSQLGDAIARGGVPLQQVVAAMLAQDGQYMRRERSFSGVEYQTGTVTVDKQVAENMAAAMSKVLTLSRWKDAAIAKLQAEYDAAGAMLSKMGNDAQTSVSGANFGSIMHNLIDQMLLSLKTKGAVDEAIQSLERGEKVVLTVANTMGSFIKEYAEDMGLNVGDPVSLSFNDLYRKYLEKQRWVRIKDGNGVKTEYRLTDDDLGPMLAKLFRETDQWMQESDFGGSPISPIDYIHAELRKHKINGKAVSTNEITGRSATIAYDGSVARLASRNPSIKSRLEAINGFNGGTVDVLVLNQSGSTGLSLHASGKFKDKRRRHMILVQAEKNIDTHMQILGRVHRTGQVVDGPFDPVNLALHNGRADVSESGESVEDVRTYNGVPASYGMPRYTQLMADIPAEMRPAAVLLGKMAKLSANTTASKDSDFSAEGVTDFINDYGGQVAVEFLLDNPDVYRALGGSDMMTLNQDEAGEQEIRRLSGYIPLLPIAQQEKIYADLIARYNELVQRETELGTNKLEAKAVDLDAETLSADIANEGKKDSTSLFAAPVMMERVSVKRQSKPLTQEQVKALVNERSGSAGAYAVARDLKTTLREDMNQFIDGYRAKHIEAGEDLARIDTNIEMMRGQAAVVEKKVDQYRIGSQHEINLEGQIFYGVVTDVKHHNRSANPAAPSAWTVQFALAMADSNMVSLPFSQLGTKFKTEAVNGTSWGDLASGGNRLVSIYELFDVAQTAAREKRWMVTGNLLAGYAQFPGQLVHYTKNDGTTAQGILMGRSFDYAKLKELMGARLKNAAKVMQYFRETAHKDKGVVADANQILRVTQVRPGEFLFTVPTSKRTGGMYSLDTELTEILGSDFVSAGGQMKLTSYSESDVKAALEHILGDQTDYFTAITNKDVAAKINETPSVLRKSQRAHAVEFPGGIDAPTANRITAGLLANLGASSANHVVVESFYELPEQVQAQARAQDSNEKTTKGLYHGGTVYIVSGNHKSVGDLEETVFHETVGHKGMRKLLGPEFVQKTNALFMQLGGLDGLTKIAAKNGFGEQFGSYIQGIAEARQTSPEKFTKAICSFILTEEVFAHMAEQKPTIYQKAKALIGWVRDWLRRHGFAKLAEYGETDILNLLNGARKALRDPNGDGPKGGVTPGVMSRELHTLVGDDYDKGLEFASEFLNELSYEDAAFRYPVSKSLTLEGNLADAYPGVEYLGEDTRPDEFGESKADRRFVFALPNETLFYVYERGNEVWIDVSRLQPGDRGGAIYHGVANYAHNTGMVFAGDPNGLSEDAIVRRTSAMLSSALRFGTTAHLDASKEQIRGVPEKGIEPLDWQGNDVAKTKALLHTFITTLQNQHPDIKNYRYDFRTQQFVRNSRVVHGLSGLGGGAARGQTVGGMDGSGEGSQPGAPRAGEGSLRRGILIQSLASSESGERPGILELVLNRSGQLVSSKETGLAAVLRRSPVQSTAEYVTTPHGRKAITERLASLFKRSDVKTFGWFHKTIGTQFHKAKIDRDYGRVFDYAQSFIDDVARFGAESADLAPGILPKMDTIGSALREVKNFSRDKADAKAIAAPIFEGTLYEDADGNAGKVWSDDELRTKFSLNDRQIGLYRQFRKAVDHSLESLAIAEMNKTAKVNELEMPEAPMGIRELSDFYAAQIGNPLRELKERLARLKKDATGDNEALWENAVKLGKGRAEYHKILKQKEEEEALQQKKLMDEIEKLQAVWDGIVGKKNTILKLQREGYAPLMRFGKYTVDVVEKVPALGEDGKPIIDKASGEMKMEDKRHFFGMFETEQAAREAARELADEYPTATVTPGVASENGYQLFGSVNADSLEMIARLAGKEDEVVQKFYKEAVSSRSALKRLIHRQGIEGYSDDVTRTLASFLLSNARATASAMHFGDLVEAAADIPKEKGDVKDEAVRLINYIRNPNEEAGALRGLLFMQFLGGSIASAVTNLTQTITTTMPYLHQFGVSPADLFSAAKLARKRFGAKESTGDEALDAALAKAEAEGVVSPHNIHALMGETRAQGAMRHRGIRLMSHMWGSFFGMAEQFNRETAFIAAFKRAEAMGYEGRSKAFEKLAELNRSRGLPAPNWKTFANSFEFAKNAVNETQFVLSKAARPNWARGAIGATMFTFKQFAVFYLELMKRLPNRERALMLATLIVLAGVGGAPGADDLDDLIDTIGQAFGYDTNSERAKMEFATKVFGRTGGEFVLHGVSAFMPLDLSSRIGMGNLLPSSAILKKSSSGNRDKEIAELMGAAGGYYKQLADAWDYTLQGRYGMAITQGLAPKAVKDVAKGIDMARRGTYDDTHGRRVVDVDTLDALIKAIGFQPTDVSRIQKAKYLFEQDKALLRSVKASIAEIWAQGIHDNDADKKRRAQDLLKEWNTKNPTHDISIKKSQVMRRANEMSKSGAERYIKATPKEMRGMVAEALAAAEN